MNGPGGGGAAGGGGGGDGDVDAASQLAAAGEIDDGGSFRRVRVALVPIRPRRRGERRSLRTLPGVSLRPLHAFNPHHRRLSTPTDAFQLHPDIASYGTALSMSITRDFMGAVGFYRRGGVGAVRFGRIVVERSGGGYVLREEDVQALETSHPLIAMKMHRMMAGNLANQVRSIQKFFTHRPVLTFDRVFFQLTDELFLYGMALR